MDVIVVGGGHAGIEAAHICAVRGLQTLLITGHIDFIGQMSCNPAIGGIAKGIIVREIDAMGGLMGKLIDNTGIHFRMLNRSKGMAVWGPRAQADKCAYRHLARKMLEQCENLHLLQGLVVGVRAEAGKIKSVVTDSGEEISASAVILAMGTFLNGIIHIGMTSFSAGRSGEPASAGLTESLHALGIQSGRLKTGTSPRIDGRTVDFTKLEIQHGDDDPWPFSFSTQRPLSNRVCCWISRTNRTTHDIIRENLQRSPLYCGKITSTGPRYCPSVETKVVQFGDRDGHALFLEPETIDFKELYLNGLSTSLPVDVQQKMVRSIPGLERGEILRPGYGIEYDYFFPTQLHPTLESKAVENLFFAGQINGTSGYEEAACQGLICGINAAEKIQGGDPLILGRDQAYIGVLIDDLVNKGTDEPYRMFTSRAEHRLLLRQDNADERLMPHCRQRGLISEDVYSQRARWWERKREWLERLGEAIIFPEHWQQGPDALTQQQKALNLLRRPGVSIEMVLHACGMQIAERDMRASLEADIKYEGFIRKQEDAVARLLRGGALEAELPAGLDYHSMPGLPIESRIKLSKNRPRTIREAGSIPGVTPADISVLLRYAKQGVRRNDVPRETVVL